MAGHRGLLQQFNGRAVLTPNSLEWGLLSAATFLSRFFLDQVGDLLKNALVRVGVPSGSDFSGSLT
jgi:hypothetical protein